jgi:hypothetical protein
MKGVTGRATRLLTLALAFSTCYLGFGLAGRMAAEQRFQSALDQQGIVVSEVRAVPMAFNSLVWRVLAKTPDGDYYEGISSVFDQQPPEMQRLSRNLELAQALNNDLCTSACAGSPMTGCVTTRLATRWWSPTCAWVSPGITPSVSTWLSVIIKGSGWSVYLRSGEAAGLARCSTLKS